MINYIIINGTNSNTINGLGINELPPISKPPLRVQTEEIDGRDGDISTNLGYGAYDKTISIGLFGTGYDINEVISFFNGEGTVVFSNEPNKYYKYKIINQIDYEALLKFKSATITFHCQPFKYPLEETPLEIEYEYIEQEGVESATMNNTNGGTSLKIDLKGNTSQYTTTGKNKFNINNLTTINGATYVINNESLTVTSTNLSTDGVYQLIDVTSNTDYIISGSIDSGGASRVALQMRLNSSSGWENFTVIKDGVGAINQTFNTGNYTQIRVLLYSNFTTVSTYVSATFSNIMVSLNGGDYEPYTNGASPNPDYPQPINVVSGDNTIKVEGKNLTDVNTYVKGFINSSGVYSDSGVSSFIIQDGTIAITTTSSNRGAVSDYIEVKPNTNYIFSFTKVGTMTTYTRFVWYDENKNAISRVQQYTYLTSPNNAKYVRIVVEMGEAGTYTIKDIQLEQNTSSTTYEPYNGDTYELDLRTSKNLLDKSTIIQGVELNSSSGLIQNNANWWASDFIAIKPNTNYTSSYISSTSKYWYDSNKSFISRTTSTTATSPINARYVRVNGTIATLGDNLQFEEGNTATTYEPYNSLKMRGIGTYEDYFVRNSGKNLISIPFYQNSNTTLRTEIPNFKPGTYTFHFEMASLNGDQVTARKIVGGVNTQIKAIYNGNTLTFDLDEEATLQLEVYKIGILLTDISQPMLNEGSSASAYEPYGTGQWCKYNAIGKVVLDGTENWDSFTSFGNYYRTKIEINDSKTYSVNTSNGQLCNYFNYNHSSTFTAGNAQIGTFAQYKETHGFYFVTNETTLANFKTWLSTHNTIVYYVLATPYLSLIEDETLISQLDNIQNAMSYEGQTNVSQTNNDKPFLLDLIAMKDGSDEVVINNIGNVYAKPTIALEGTGETDIYLNNTEILKVDLSEKNKITIDTNNMEAYDSTDNSLANRKVIGNYNSMTLPSGNTTMKITGALTKATITDYSRWL